jgi:hypothetical protein
MNWFKTMFKLGNIKNALVQIYDVLGTSVIVLKNTREQLDASKNKYAEDIGKTIDACNAIMGVIRKILYVLGVNVDAPKSKTIKLTLIDLNNKIGELNKIEI